MRYLGSKESLTGSIRELLQERNLLQGNLVFFDAFCGMGSVADSLKSTFNHIIVNDSKVRLIFHEREAVSNRCTFQMLGFDPFSFLKRNMGTVPVYA